MVIEDPFAAALDPELPTVASALDPEAVKHRFKRRLPRLAGTDGTVSVRAIRVVRHKPGRRCVVEYDLRVDRPGEAKRRATVLGKIRARRYGKADYDLLDLLWRAGFDAESADGISVPEPIAVVPKMHMWLQRKVPGTVATELLAGEPGPALGRRVAEAAHKIHRAGVPARRTHTIDDELAILRRCLDDLARAQPRRAQRVRRLLAGCERLAETLPAAERCGIHRDFYADQVVVDGERLHLIDFDLYCLGDPALDIGNFLGHLAEQSVRTYGDPDALADVECALEERFVELAGERVRRGVRGFAVLTLARLVYLSTRLPGRGRLTPQLLEVSEQRLAHALRL